MTTRFTVTWTKSAVAELADLWLEADDREAITLATAAIDRELALDPTTKVRSLSEGLSFIDSFPLRVFCEIRESDRIVEVVGVRMIRGPNGQHPAGERTG